MFTILSVLYCFFAYVAMALFLGTMLIADLKGCETKQDVINALKDIDAKKSIIFMTFAPMFLGVLVVNHLEMDK